MSSIPSGNVRSFVVCQYCRQHITIWRVFIGTSFYLMLLVPLGLAAKVESIRQIGLITAVMSGVMLFILGLGYLLL